MPAFYEANSREKEVIRQLKQQLRDVINEICNEEGPALCREVIQATRLLEDLDAEDI